MIRRTLQGGLLAAVALFALVPTTAVAAVGDQVTPAPVVAPAAATIPHRPHTMPPALVRHAPARHGVHHTLRRHHHARHFRHFRLVTRAAYHRHGTPVMGRVVTWHAVNVRSGPGFRYRVIGRLHAQSRVLVSCKTHGSYVHGDRIWYRLACDRGYVSAHYIRTWRAVSWC